MIFPPLTEDELEFVRQAGRDPDDECYVLAMRTMMDGWVPALIYGDVKWTQRFVKEMDRHMDQPDLVRLKAMYVWTLNNPPKRR